MSGKKYIAIHNRIPTIISFDSETMKVLVPLDWTVGYLMSQIRNKIKLMSNESIYVLANNKLVSQLVTIEDAYDMYKDDEGYLRLLFCRENTFG